MKHHPNSNKHKAMHGGYKSRPTRKEVQATLNFFDTSDFNKVLLVATSGKGKPRLGTQLKLF